MYCLRNKQIASGRYKYFLSYNESIRTNKLLNCTASIVEKQYFHTPINAAQDNSYELNKLPQETRVVIGGGGIMGAAVAYQLALLGWGSETVILEKGRYVKCEYAINFCPDINALQ